MHAPSRREFIALLARAGVGATALASIPPWARRALAAARPAMGAALIERNAYPQHLETTLGALDQGWLTPANQFFVRSHFQPPTIDPRTWRLELGGLVHEPFSLTLAELHAMPTTSVTSVLECAGNGRGLFRMANTSGTQWERGAVGNAKWTGVRLADILRRAKPAAEARHLWFEGADAAPLDTVPKFLRSIPLEKAMHDVVLAYKMNDSPLPHEHGAPLRSIVLGWYGMASTKWLTRIRAEVDPSDNHFMAKGYRYVPPGGDPAASPPVEELRVKSLITHPHEGARVPAGVVLVRGFAWAGPASVRKVEVSADGGATWRDAAFIGASAPSAWRRFGARLTLARGNATLMARASDGAGNVQPLEAAINTGGYGNNSVHRVHIHVGA